MSEQNSIKKVPTHFMPIPERRPSFSPMLQGTGPNRLTQISTRNADQPVDAITGLATITNGNLTVFIEKYNSLAGGLRISTHKLLDACTIALTAQNNYRKMLIPKTLVTIPLEDYMHRCGIPMTKSSKDKTRRKVKEDLETLFNTSIEWTEPSGKQTRDFAKMRICDMVGIKGGNILMNFSHALAQYLIDSYIMQYSLELFKVDDRNPNTYYLGKKLLQHHSIDNNQKRGTANIISVRAALDSMPEIPTYKKVKRIGRQVEQRIISPFENTLNTLSGTVLTSWEYCNSKGTPLTDEQLKDFDYFVFIDCYINFEVLNAPAQTARLLAKAEKAKQAQK
jgi:hypothetical protein